MWPWLKSTTYPKFFNNLSRSLLQRHQSHNPQEKGHRKVIPLESCAFSVGWQGFGFPAFDDGAEVGDHLGIVEKDAGFDVPIEREHIEVLGPDDAFGIRAALVDEHGFGVIHAFGEIAAGPELGHDGGV